jgi:DNA-binding IscR family transcriptional regulator
MLDILEASEGDARRQTCVLTGKACGGSAEPCDVHAMFFDAQEAILTRLSQTSVEEVVRGAPVPIEPLTPVAAMAS